MFSFRTAPLIISAGLVALLTPVAYGQRWEFGAGGGASFYTKQTIPDGSGAVEAKFKPGYGFSAFLGQIGNRVGGEIRYTWLSNEMELAGGGKSFTMGGRSQAIHYDVNVYFKGKESTVRPYMLIGGGMKQYTGTGDAIAFQPLGNVVVLTNTSEWKPLATAGAGVRIALNRRTAVRAEVRAYATQSPNRIITPVSGATLSGWYFDIVPMVNISYTW